MVYKLHLFLLFFSSCSTYPTFTPRYVRIVFYFITTIVSWYYLDDKSINCGRGLNHYLPDYTCLNFISFFIHCLFNQELHEIKPIFSRETWRRDLSMSKLKQCLKHTCLMCVLFSVVCEQVIHQLCSAHSQREELWGDRLILTNIPKSSFRIPGFAFQKAPLKSCLRSITITGTTTLQTGHSLQPSTASLPSWVMKRTPPSSMAQQQT